MGLQSALFYQLESNPCYLGEELFWWRESPDLHTLITIYWGAYDLPDEPIVLHLGLFDPTGRLAGVWQKRLAHGQVAVIDSRDWENLPSFTPTVSEGILAVTVLSQRPPSPLLKSQYRRLYAMTDWFGEKGELGSLHSDQCRRPGRATIEFTEIAFKETERERHALILLNGPESQAAGAVTLTIKNHLGQKRSAIYQPPMRPYSIHRLWQSDLFPGLIEFSGGHTLYLGGTFQAQGLFTRPYVLGEGSFLSIYHGGNRYRWRSLPGLMFRYLGQGEMNPMLALHEEGITTTVNLFNSHGDLEEDFWVDAELFDEDGHPAGRREKWLSARRYGLSRGHLRDLLADPRVPFRGHIALRYSECNRPCYPRHLQALVEYRSAVNYSRIMAWSDCWNTPDRLTFARDVDYRCFFRLWCQPPLQSRIAITNCGSAPDYSETATFLLHLVRPDGRRHTHRSSVGPKATLFLFPHEVIDDLESFAGCSPVLLALIESPFDLAVVQTTRHPQSGVMAGEHFLAAATRVGESFFWPAGW